MFSYFWWYSRISCVIFFVFLGRLYCISMAVYFYFCGDVLVLMGCLRCALLLQVNCWHFPFLYFLSDFLVFLGRFSCISFISRVMLLYLWGVSEVHFCCRWIVNISLSCISWVIFLYFLGSFLVFLGRCISISWVMLLYLWGAYEVHSCCRWIGDISFLVFLGWFFLYFMVNLFCISWAFFCISFNLRVMFLYLWAV